MSECFGSEALVRFSRLLYSTFYNIERPVIFYRKVYQIYRFYSSDARYPQGCVSLCHYVIILAITKYYTLGEFKMCYP